jgi:hypothetical protein
MPQNSFELHWRLRKVCNLLVWPKGAKSVWELELVSYSNQVYTACPTSCSGVRRCVGFHKIKLRSTRRWGRL